MAQINLETYFEKLKGSYTVMRDLLALQNYVKECIESNNEIDKTKLDSKVFKSYAANSILLKLFELNKEDYKKYMKRVKEDKVIDNLLSDTLGRKIKKLIVRINTSLYYKKLSK